MSTCANIHIRDWNGNERLLYHHHDGDQVGLVIAQFIRDIPTGDTNDFADFLKDYTCPDFGYQVNEFEDAKVVSTDINFMYYVTLYRDHKKTVEGFKFPHPPVMLLPGDLLAKDDLWEGDRIYGMFSTTADFTKDRIRKHWRQSFYFVHGVSEEELGGGQSPKTMEGESDGR